MWVPRSAAELEQAILERTLPRESAGLDVKAGLPGRNKRSDIAVDVAAMATDGGVLIYGVRENKTLGIYESAPIELAGAQELVSEVVMANVRERIEFSATPLGLSDDPSRGYLVLDIPASPRAPHMVETKNDHRFYGRSPTGNVILTEAQVAALYARREHFEDMAAAALARSKAKVVRPELQKGENRRGDLLLFAHPILGDSKVRERGWKTTEMIGSLEILRAADSALRFHNDAGGLNLADIMSGTSRARLTLEGLQLFDAPFAASDGEIVTNYVSELQVLDAGTLHYFRVRVARESGRPFRPDEYIIWDEAIGQLTARFCRLAGSFFDRAEYHGPVVVAIVLLGVKDAASSRWLGTYAAPPPSGYLTVPGDYEDVARVSVASLLERPAQVASNLLERLYRTIRAEDWPDPLQLEAG